MLITARTTISKNVTKIGSRPVGAFALDSDKEIAEQRTKSIRFLILDIFLLSALIVCELVALLFNESELYCENFVLPPVTITLVLVLISLVIDWITLNQIKKFYVGRCISYLSLSVDLIIFGCAIWLAYDVSQINDNCPKFSPLGKAGAAIIVIVVFTRVYNVLLMFLFVFFVFPMYFMPDCCICKKWVNSQSFDESVWDLLVEGEWVYHERAMSHTK